MPGLFARFLEGCGIVAQYSIPGMASQNGVADRRNRTLIDIWYGEQFTTSSLSLEGDLKERLLCTY